MGNPHLHFHALEWGYVSSQEGTIFKLEQTISIERIVAFAPTRPALRRRTTFAVPHGTGAPWRRTIEVTTPSP